MKQIDSLKKLAEFFWQMEQKFNLIDYTIDGVKIWQYSRFRIFNLLAVKTGVYKQAHTKKVGFLDQLKALPQLLFSSVFFNPLFGKYQKDVLIFNTGRKVKIDGRYEDIYLDYFIRRGDFGDYELIDELYQNKHLKSSFKKHKRQDYQFLRMIILRMLNRRRFSKETNNDMSDLETYIEEQIGIKVQLNSILLNGFKQFQFDYQYYDKLLKKRKPTKVVMVCSYDHKKALVAAAKANGVVSVEYQHGTMTKYHLGYSYPMHDNIDYFPDQLMVFGEYWKDAVKLPISKERMKVCGFNHFRKSFDQYKHFEKGSDQNMLVISQGAIGDKMADVFFDEKQLLKDFDISYKLHPGEFDSWRLKYPKLKQLSDEGVLNVIDNNEKHLYQNFAEAKVVVGVYSTAVFEALAFGCQVVLLDLPGVEYMDDLVESQHAIKVKSISELVRAIHIEKNTPLSESYYFAEC
jgi:hypothetical protein